MTQQPPPPRNTAYGSGGNTTADAFFNDFSQPTSTTTSVRPRGPPPPQQQHQFGPPHPPGGVPQQQQPTSRLPVSSVAGRGPVRNTVAAVTATTTVKPRPPPPSQPRPPSGSQNSIIPQQQPQQPSSNAYYNSTTAPSNLYGVSAVGPPASVPPQPSVYEEPPSNDWYTPSAMDNNSYGIAPQQSQYSQPANTAATAPYHPNYTNHPTSTYFNGAMDTSGRDTTPYPTPQTFIPQVQPPPPPYASTGGAGDLTDDYYDKHEPPLLEELGVNWEHIMMKTKAVVIPFRRFQTHSALADPSIIVEDADLAGPLAYALLLGGELLVTGKLQFGYIYGFGLFGCLAMTLILNLMSPTSISFWTVTSILGYALIPVNILAAIKIVLFSFGTLVQILALITVLWSTTASTRLLEIGFGLADQRYLLAYPIALLYSAFVLITIF